MSILTSVFKLNSIIVIKVLGKQHQKLIGMSSNFRQLGNLGFYSAMECSGQSEHMKRRHDVECESQGLGQESVPRT